jgi:hypothetical protein
LARVAWKPTETAVLLFAITGCISQLIRREKRKIWLRLGACRPGIYFSNKKVGSCFNSMQEPFEDFQELQKLSRTSYLF